MRVAMPRLGLYPTAQLRRAALRRHPPPDHIPPCLSMDPPTKGPPDGVTKKAPVDDHDDNGVAASWLMLKISSPSLRVVRPLRRRRRARGGIGLWPAAILPPAWPVVNAPCAPFYIGKHPHFRHSAARKTGGRPTSSVQWLEFRPDSGSDRTKEKGGAATRQGRTA